MLRHAPLRIHNKRAGGGVIELKFQGKSEAPKYVQKRDKMLLSEINVEVYKHLYSRM
eukprot:c37262_g1_i1 orf=219-389(-)